MTRRPLRVLHIADLHLDSDGSSTMLSLRFPTGVLFDVMMRGGPLPVRYEPLGGQLMKPGPLDFTREEAIAIRNWLAQQPEGFIDPAR